MTQEICTNLKTYVNAQAERMNEYPINNKTTLAGQPQINDWETLTERGFQTIINMRSDSKWAALEAKNVQALGLNYIHLPLPVYELEPEHIETFQNVLSRLNGNKVYIHCRSGSRVGLLWLLKRVTYDNCSQEQAEGELRAAGYDEEGLETFQFCAEDFFERTATEGIE